MIDSFEKETAPLSEYERDILLPIMVKCLEKHRGKDRAVSNRQMLDGLEGRGYSVGSTARIRKLINHIRVNGLLECLMATRNGYYITDDPDEMRRYISSLKGREEAICAVRMAMKEQLEKMNRNNRYLCTDSKRKSNENLNPNQNRTPRMD